MRKKPYNFIQKLKLSVPSKSCAYSVDRETDSPSIIRRYDGQHVNRSISVAPSEAQLREDLPRDSEPSSLTTHGDAVVVSLSGDVVAKGRPRFSRAPNGSVSAHTPEKTRNYETSLRWAAKAAMGGREPLTVPVSMSVIVSIEIPASWPAWKRSSALNGSVRPTTKPDADNYLKAVMDAFNKVIYADDAQAVSVSIEKLYAEQSGLVATVTPLAAVTCQSARRRP